MQKLKAVLDNKGTWMGIGVLASVLFGDTGSSVVNAIGQAVMAVL